MNPSERAASLLASERTGLVFAGLCALNGAFVPAVARLTTDRADAVAVAALTTLFAAAAAAVVLGVRGELRMLVARGRGPLLAVVGALGTAVAFFLYFLGVQRTSAIDAALCLQIEPVYSLVVSWLFLGHRPTRRRLVAAATLMAGIALSVEGSEARDALGVTLLLVTPLCWQASHLLVLSRLPGVPPPVLTGARYLYGGLLLGGGWMATGGLARLPAGDGLSTLLPVLALQGVVLSYVGTLFWYLTIARLDLARATSIVVPSVPLLSIGVSWLLVGEVPTPGQLLGAAVTVAGVAAFVTAPHAVEERERIPSQTAPVAVAADPEPGPESATG